jgi:hypothetical protein
VLAPVHFPSPAGWYAGAGVVRACPGVSAQRCRFAPSWAGTVVLLDCVNCLPHRTVAKLPADGVVIQASISLERPRRLNGPAWPPRIDPRAVTNFEGLPPRIGVFQATARDGPFDVLVMVFFGRPHPSPRQVASAQAELSGARLP